MTFDQLNAAIWNLPARADLRRKAAMLLDDLSDGFEGDVDTLVGKFEANLDDFDWGPRARNLIWPKGN